MFFSLTKTKLIAIFVFLFCFFTFLSFYAFRRPFDQTVYNPRIAGDKIVASSDNIPPLAVSNLAIINASSTAVSLFLTWTASGDDDDQGTATIYDLRFSTSNIKKADWDSAIIAIDPPAPQPAGALQSYTAGGLTADTKYYFGLKTADEAGNVSDLSNIASDSTTKNKIKKLKIKLQLEGKTQYQTNLELRILPIDSELILDSKSGQSNNLGEEEISNLNLDEDYYDLKLFAPYYLSKKKSQVMLADNIEIDFQTLLTGNLFDGDNVINALDWQVMRANWGTPEAIADINQDSLVNTIDWSLMKKNWGLAGD